MNQVTAYFRRPHDGAIITRTLEVDGPAAARVPIPDGLEPIDEAEALAGMLVELGLEGELAAFLTGGGPAT
jgi:hypothetical protein